MNLKKRDRSSFMDVKFECNTLQLGSVFTVG